jgi:hypothetical protein
MERRKVSPLHNYFEVIQIKSFLLSLDFEETIFMNFCANNFKAKNKNKITGVDMGTLFF